MKAIVQPRYGGVHDLELREVSRPVVAPDEVLVRVRAASLHPDVWHVVRGRPWVLRLMGAGFRRPRNPIPGSDMAGVVVSVGSEVPAFREGDEVFGETIRSHAWTHGGAYAEYVSVRQDGLAHKPAGVTFEEAACAPTAGFIALQNLRALTVVQPGDRVLVNGAAGGVGSLALQMVKARGAHVTGVDHTAKLDMMRALGADAVLDYTVDDFTRRDERYDLVFDVPGNHPVAACLKVLRPEGKYVLIGHEQYGASGRPVLGLLPDMIGLVLRSLFVKQLRLGRASVPDRPEVMRLLAELMAGGAVKPVVERAYPLEEVGEAFRHMMEDAPLGRIVLAP